MNNEQLKIRQADDAARLGRDWAVGYFPLQGEGSQSDLPIWCVPFSVRPDNLKPDETISYERTVKVPIELRSFFGDAQSLRVEREKVNFPTGEGVVERVYAVTERNELGDLILFTQILSDGGEGRFAKTQWLGGESIVQTQKTDWFALMQIPLLAQPSGWVLGEW